MANYGSDESHLSDPEEEEVQKPVVAEQSSEKVVAEQSSEKVAPDPQPDIHISDDEDDEPRAVFDGDDDVTDDVSGTSFFASLAPAASAPPSDPPDKSVANMVDQNEDLSTIPKAKTYQETPGSTSCVVRFRNKTFDM